MNFVIFFFLFFFLLGYIRKFTARKHNESERLCVKFHDSFAMFGKNSSYSREVVLRVVLQFVEERKRSFVNDGRRIFCNDISMFGGEGIENLRESMYGRDSDKG